MSTESRSVGIRASVSGTPQWLLKLRTAAWTEPCAANIDVLERLRSGDGGCKRLCALVPHALVVAQVIEREVDGDAVVLSNPATGSYASAHAGSGLNVTASSASTLSSATNGAATVYGYQVSSSPASGSVGTITPKAVTASASIGGTTSKVYDGLTAASGASVNGSTSGAITGDTVALDVVVVIRDGRVVVDKQ